jgi:hypothetical protein
MHIYSDEGMEHERTTPNFGARFEELNANRRSAEENRKSLLKAVRTLIRLSTELGGIERRFAADGVPSIDGPELSILDSLRSTLNGRSVEEWASILAYFVIDAHLTFFKPDGKD